MGHEDLDGIKARFFPELATDYMSEEYFKKWERLDDAERLRNFSKADMFAFIEDIPEAIKTTLDAIKAADFTTPTYDSIVFCGMGGSAIAGDLAADILMPALGMNISCIRNYKLPPYVNHDTLIVAISYSGNTEETLSCVEEALKIGAQVITISSGGKLEDIARGEGLVHIPVPKGYPPRSAVGYLLTSALLAPVKGHEAWDKIASDLVSASQSEEFLANIAGVMPETPAKDNMAKALAISVEGKYPVIYASPELATVAYRWVTQFNENSKVLAYSGVIPEMNHNALVGWDGDTWSRPNAYPIILSPHTTHPRIRARIEFLEDLFRRRGVNFSDFTFPGVGVGLILISMIVGDAASIYLAYLRGIDPYPVDVITALKEHLASR